MLTLENSWRDDPNGTAVMVEGDDMDSVEAILAAVLAEPRARARRDAFNADRPTDDVAGWGELDLLLEAFETRLRQFQLPQEPRRGWRPKSEVEIAPPDVLPQAERYDLDDITSVEAPPLPLDIPALPEPPPLPATKRSKAPPVHKPDADGPILKPTTGATRAVSLLYEDILWLVSINDWAAALISLERLLVMASLQGDIKEFVDVNEVKLMNVYESYLGPLEKKPRRAAASIDNTMPGGYERAEKISAILGQIDGKKDLKTILRQSPYTPLETCAALNQLRRAGVIDL